MPNPQLTLFDGFQVSDFGGTFAGTFDLDEPVGYDEVVTFIVTARVGGVSISDTKSGDVKRINKFQVTSANPLAPDAAEKVLNSLGVAVNGVNAGQMSFPSSNPLKTGPVTPDDTDAAQGYPIQGDAASDQMLQKFIDDPDPVHAQ